MRRDHLGPLAAVMGFGAIYDLAFGGAILVVPRATSSLLRIPLPDDPFYLRLNAVFLLLLGALYVLPALRPERFHPMAPIAAAGRVLGGAAFALAWHAGRPAAFLVLGLADLILASLTFAAWGRARGGSPSP